MNGDFSYGTNHSLSTKISVHVRPEYANIKYSAFIYLIEKLIAMKKNRYTEGKIAFAQKQAETGAGVDEVYRKMSISETSFYNRKKKFAGLVITVLRRLQQLEDENQCFKIMVVHFSLDEECCRRY